MRPAPLSLVMIALLVPSAASAQALDCQPHDRFLDQMTASGAYLAMAEVLRDDPTRRLEAFYQPDTCLWTLVIVTLVKGQVAPNSTTCLMGEGDPGVCIPPR